MSLIKKDMQNPSDDAANASEFSATSDATQLSTSMLVLKSVQEPGNSENLVIRSFSCRHGS